TLSRLVPEDDDEALPARLLRALPPWEVTLLARLVGKPRHMSVHPGGVVIAWPSVERYVPLERAPKGVLVTQLDLRSIGHLGLVKIDLLGSHGLAAIDATVRSLPSPPSFASPDPATSRLLGEADTIGCAQIETGSVRGTLRA